MVIDKNTKVEFLFCLFDQVVQYLVIGSIYLFDLLFGFGEWQFVLVDFTLCGNDVRDRVQFCYYVCRGCVGVVW